MEDFSDLAVMVDQAHEVQSGLSIEDAEILVTGGRGLGSPEGFSLMEAGDLKTIVPQLTALVRERRGAYT